MSDIVAKLADGTELRFPAGTADNVVDTTVKNYLGDPANQVATAPQAQAPVAPTGPEGAPIPPILKSEPPPEPTTATEALGHGIVKSILPSAAGLVAGATGATLGSVAGPGGTLAGGIGLGFTAAEKVAEIQDEFLKEHPKVANLLGVDPKQTLREELEHPYAAFTGQLIPNLAAMRPSGALLRSAKGLTQEAAKQLQARKVAAGVNALINSAITGGLETGQELISGQELDPKKIALAAGAGLAGQKETAIGRKLSLLGEKLVPSTLKSAEPNIRRPEERKPVVEVGQPTIVPSPETEAYNKEFIKAQEAEKPTPKPTETTVAPESDSHDTQAMMDELSGKEIPLDESQFQEEVKPIGPPRLTEEEKAQLAPLDKINAKDRKIHNMPTPELQAMADKGIIQWSPEFIDSLNKPKQEVKPTEIPKKTISNAKDLVKDLGGESAQQLRDDFNPTYNYTNKDGVEVTFKEEGKVFNLVPGDEDTQVGSDIHLDYIGSKDRNKGLASKELDRIINKADENNLSISLEVDKQDKNGLSNDQLKDWYQRKGFVFPRGNDIGYRPRPSEDLGGYPEKTIQVPEGKIQDVGKQINSDLTGRTFSDEETFYEMFNSGSLKEGYQVVPTESAPEGYDEIYYYDGKNKPVRISDVYARYDSQNNKTVVERLTRAKQEPTGVITEEDKEFTPVGGRLINKADVEKIGTESKRALEQNLKEQEAAKDKQLKTEAREEKFKVPPTQTLSARLVELKGIAKTQKGDMLGETGKVEGYEHVFRDNGGDLLTMVKDGLLDDYLPPDIRTSATPPDGFYDARPGYNYISDLMKTGEKVHHYDYEMAKLQHENMVYEKNLAKQQMEPNEAAQAATAEVQGKEYMNIKPDEIVPPLTKGPEVGTMEWLTEDNPPIHSLYEGNKSLRVEMNKLVKHIESGRASDAEVKDAVLNIHETTKKPKEINPLVRGPEHIKARLLEAKRNGTLAPKAVDMAEWLINKNPEIMRESAISIKEEPTGNKKAGAYDPAQRLIQLFNHVGDEKTPVHESLHSVEKLLPEDIRSGIRKAWLNNLFKEYNTALKGKDENLKQYFKAIVDYHRGENPIGDKVAKDLIQKGLVNKSNYQFFNPSEFWAIRGSDIVADRFHAEISKSTVNRLKQWIKEFIQKLKNTFGLNSDAPIIRALDSLAKSDGKFKTNDMLAESAEYASISPPPKNFKGQDVIPQWHAPDESKVDNLLYKLQDKHIDTKRIQQIITKAGHDIEDNWNVYEKEMLYHGRTASGIRNFLLKEVLPAAREMQKLKVTPEEIHTYLLNRHAEERNIQMNKLNPAIYDPKTNTTKPNPLKDQGSGIHTDKAREYLNNLDPVKKQHLEEVAKHFDNMIKDTQDILVASGAETRDTINKWNQTYKHYVPLMRIEDASSKIQGMIGTGQGLASRGAFSKRALGSLKEHEDILGNIIAQRERAIIRAEKIRVGRALYGLSIQSPNPDFWLPINPDAIRNKTQAIAELTRLGIQDAKLVVDNLMAEPKERYLKKVKEAEGFEPEEDFDFDSGLPVNQSKEVVASKVNVMARYRDNVFPVRVNGKDRFIFFNKNDPRAMRMVQALKNLDVEELGAIETIAGHYTRWFKNVNTQYNPVFGLKNFIRDYSAGNLNLTSTPINGAQAQITKDMMPAMRGILEVHRAERKGITTANTQWGKFYQLMRNEGFQTGYRDSLIRNQEEMQLINHLLEQMNESGVKANAKKAFYHIAGALTDFNDVMENSIRLAAAKAALDKGLSPQKAAVIAKNITVNFDKKGSKTRSIGALYAFFNPAVQGTERIYQTLKSPYGKAIIGGGILAGMIQAVMMAAAGYEDNDPPEFTRQKAFVIPMPDGHYIPIPYPQGYNILPNVGRQTMDFIIHGGKNPGKHIADLTAAMMDSLSPLGTVGWTLQSIAPTVLDPVAAIAENKDAFGRPIYKKDRETAPSPGYTRSRDTVSTLGQGIAEFLNFASGGDKYIKGSISPTGDEVDYLAGQVGGGLYREVSKAVQYAKAQFTGEEVPAYRVPIVGQFHGEVGQPAAIANKFYENVTRMTDHENTIKGLRKDKLPKDEYMAKHPEAKLWNRANGVENEINNLNKQKRIDIQKNKPKEVIQRIEAKKTLKMQQFNDAVKRLNPD